MQDTHARSEAPLGPGVVRSPRRGPVRATLLLLTLLLAACGGEDGPPTGVNPGPTPTPVRPTLPTTYTATGLGASGAVSVQLFEWAWADVARECELHLGPMGYEAALVSPPQEHIGGAAWWTRYQPVSYSLAQTRGGTRAQFADMVTRCAAAGVDIYVDAVINHMTGGNGTGSNGSVYTKYSYPGLYGAGDFHTACGIVDWGSPAQVQDCELVGLADLRTGSSSVQQKIVDYLADLVGLGVAGFRIDAAKHIQPVELDSIMSKLGRAAVGLGKPRPYVFLEVIDMGDYGVKATDYYGIGHAGGSGSDISEFKFRGIGDKFLGVGGQKVSDLATFSQSAWGLMPSDKALTFVQNHDTQRSGGLRWTDGDMARLANVFMLTDPYGYPMIMSGYAFDPTTGAGRDAGPPAGNGTAAGQTCATTMASAAVGTWVCEHRDPWLRPLIRFRKAVKGTARTANWNDGAQAVAFSRGDQGFVVINNATASITVTIPTGLAAGTYCDLLTGGKVGAGCAGTSHTVAANGALAVTLGARSAVVLLVGDQP